MEKVIYFMWRDPSADAEQFGKNLRGPLCDRLLAGDVRGLHVNIMDAAVAPAVGLRQINLWPQPEAFVSVWVDSAIDYLRRPVDDIVAAAAWRIAAYLVSESMPIRNTRHQPRPGQRTEGFSQIALLGRPPRLTPEQWRNIWQNSHTKVAIDTQSTFLYVQNLVLRPLTYGAPIIDALVEEGFPAAAMNDSQVFFDALGDEKKYQKNLDAMMESCNRFIDFDRIDVVPTSQYVLKPVAA